MLFNVIGYDNEVIGQVEAKDAVEAWEGAGKMFNNILDVREVEELLDYSYKKEPWQMTLEEYAYEQARKYGHGKPRMDWIRAGYGEVYRSHKMAVKRAISEGKPIPSEVLKDYPELKELRTKQVTTPIDELYVRELMDKVTRYELSEIISHLPYEPEIKALPYEPYLYPIYFRDETKASNINYLIKWIKRYPEKVATRLIIQRLEEKVKEKEQYPIKGPVPGTHYITWEDFTKLPGYPLIARAVDYPHDYRRKCSPVTKDGYLSVDAIYNLSAWASWKSSSLDPMEMQIARAIGDLHLYELMQLNHGRRADQPALFPERLLPI